MENENKNIENENPVHTEDEVKNKTGRGKTAVILAVTLMAGLLTGGGIYKFRHGSDAEKTVEVKEMVTTVTFVSDPAYETEETTEEVTTAETTSKETTAVTTVPVTETPDETTAITTEVTEVTKSSNELYWESLKNSPLRNQKHNAYSDILDVLPMLESFNFRFACYSYYLNSEPEYKDIVVGADVTYSYQALKPIESGSVSSESNGLKPTGGVLHSNRYYKVSTLGPDYQNEDYKYKTEEDVRSALEEYFTDSFIENHYISDYDKVPGRYTIFKIIDGELYVTYPDDMGMMLGVFGNVYNYDGKRCDVKIADYSPDIHSDPMHVSLVLEDGKWKIDGYEHTGNIVNGSTYFKDLYNEYKDVGVKAVEDLKALENVVLCCGVTTDENDTLTEEYDGTTVVYQRVTDDRFSNVSEIENFICSHSVADLRLRCIDYIRGANGKYPVYMMSGGELYCNKDEFNSHYCLLDKYFGVISADDDYIQLSIENFGDSSFVVGKTYLQVRIYSTIHLTMSLCQHDILSAEAGAA